MGRFYKKLMGTPKKNNLILNPQKNVLESEKMYKNNRFWQIFVRLVDATRRPGDAFLSVSEYPMKMEYVSGKEDPPENAVAEIWSEYGTVGGKHVVSDPSYREKGVRGNAVQRAVTYAENKISRRRINGYRGSKEEKKEPCGTERVLPMLAKVFDAGKIDRFPVMVQPKLDGTRMIAHLNAEGEVDLYSRQLKTVTGKSDLRKELRKVLKPDMYLDGEFYEHGKSLQKISSWYRTSSEEGSFWVFDAYFPCTEPSMPFEKRYAKIKLKFVGCKKINLVSATRETSMDGVLSLLRKFREEGFEGAIVRDPLGVYEPGKRSRGVMKLKETQTAEYPVVGVTCGEGGKSRGALVLVLETPGGKQFRSTPVGSLEKRREEYDRLKDSREFEKTLKGKLVTVEFEDLSEDKVPLRSKVIGLRPYA